MGIITIESDDKEGESTYRKIILDVLSELHIRFIKHLYVKINIKEGYFIISTTIKKDIKPLKLSDLSLEPVGEGTKITIDSMQERFLPAVLKILTSSVGKEKILQPSRYMIIVKDVNISEIKDLVIFDYATYAETIITEMIFWIAPEQFKITHVLKDEEKITILFSEYDLKESWLEEMKKIHWLPYSLRNNSQAFSGSP
ncbi:MAG: methanogenesis marker 17 protein [Candidatus Methylarchaceae archaeon HK02M1]|nr:methanogenesis marker 17 protein [Candidatus Methylarchaceae archaeon HK02M1]